MPQYLFTSILGSFVIDANLRIIDQGDKEKLLKKHKNLKEPAEVEIKRILTIFRNPKYFRDFYEQNLKITKQKIKGSVNEDLFIIQTIANIEELNKVCNILAKRLREWYSYYNPEFSYSIESHEKFVELIQKKPKKELLKEVNIKPEDSMGADIKDEDVEPMISLANRIELLYKLKAEEEKYLEKIMKQRCPNILAIAGPLIGAKLFEHAGSLKRLAILPASTIQLLGAEKALFRHMKTGAKSPKYGVIFSHPLIAKAKKEEHGKVARALADKISIASRLDYFKGEFKGASMRKELEERFSK